MIYTHSIGRALQYFPQHTALLRDGRAITFLELDARVRRMVAALRRRGFLSGDRLAFLMPNGPDYIELVYACSLLESSRFPSIRGMQALRLIGSSWMRDRVV